MANVWVFITLAILFATASRLLIRNLMTKAHPYAFSLLVQLVAAVILLPMAIINFSLPTELIPWLVLAAAAGIWTVEALVSYLAYKKTEVSLKTPLTQSRLIWALLLGIFFLGESATWQRTIGTAVMLFGIILLVFHPERKFGRLTDPGIRWTLGGAMLTAIAVTLDKLALTWFRPEVWAFLVFLLPGLILASFLKGRTKHVSHLLKKRRWIMTFTAIASTTFAYYFMLKAFSIADLTFVYPILQTSILLTVIGGIILLKERDHIVQKLIASIIIIAGVIIIGG